MDQQLAHAINASSRNSGALALCFQLASDGQVPEWIELIPAPDAGGQVIGEDGRKWRMQDAAAVAARFRRPLPFDINHATEVAAPKGGESPAAGWIEELQARNGALWGRIAWNTKGAELISGKAYRFYSPAFTFDRKTGEIHAMTSAGLVNDPNFPLALNSAEHVDEVDPMLKKLLAALGLAEDVNEETALNAVATLKNDLEKATNNAKLPDLNKYVPRADYETAVNRANTAEAQLATNAQAALDAEIETEISAALKAGKITPATKDYYVATCRADGGLAKFREFVKAAPVIADGGRQTDGQGKAAEGTAGLTENQRAICRRTGMSEDDYAKNLKTLDA